MSYTPVQRFNLPPATMNLIIINVLIWLVEMLFPSFAINGIYRHCGLHYVGATDFNPAQVITYMFVHDRGTILHVLFNMFTLFMFGPILERTWGTRRFMFFYMVCGVGAALVQEGVWALTWEHEYLSALAAQNGLNYGYMKEIAEAGLANGNANILAGMEMFKSQLMTVGASGAIFGLLLGFAFVFPNMPLYLFFIPIPIKAKWMVLGYGVLEFFLGVSGSQATVAHFAHLGGMLFGLIILLYWRKKGTLRGNSFFN